MRRDDWRDRSACQDQDPDLFFAERGRQADRATAPCRECPVRRECLNFAVESPWAPYGVWGGLPTKQVRSLWRERHPDYQPTGAHELTGLRKDRSTW